MQKDNFKGGLKPHKKSKKDYSLKKTYKLGAFDLSTLPDEYILPSTILNQDGYKCTAYSACSTREVQAGIRFDPDWFYAQEGVVAGEVSETGYELRTAMQTGKDKGFRPLSTGEPADKYKEDSFFAIDDVFDKFDDIRVAMWIARDEKRCAMLGTEWYSNWTGQSIITQGQNPSGGHAVKCAGWKKIDGVLYLIIQNSYGENVGDKGFHYFPREIVNKEFTYGLFCWRLRPDNVRRIGILQTILQLLQQWLNLLKKPVPQPPPQSPISPQTAPPSEVKPEIKPAHVYPPEWLDFSNKDDKLIQALIMKESAGDDSRIGDLNLVNKAYGCLQFRQPAVDDINHAYDTNFKAQDMLNNRELSIYACKAYWAIWATRARLGHEPTWEDKARILNGGPTGWKNPRTEYYWADVKKFYLKT